jgi:signal transduction histidine kinase
MNRKGWGGNTSHLQTMINVTFLVLAVFLGTLMFIYWNQVMVPQLKTEAKRSATMLAESLANTLAVALATEEEERLTNVVKAMDNLLILKERKTGIRFILGVKLEVDYDVIKAREGELDLARGETGCHTCFTTEVALYSEATKELLGIATFYSNDRFFQRQKKDLRSGLFAGAGVVIAIFSLVWFALRLLIRKIGMAEKKLKEQQAQMVQAGRLTAMGEMATGIAHEINQPLTIIGVAAHGLKTYFAKLGPETMEAMAAQKIEDQVKRAAAIIDNMRSFVRARPGPLEAINLAEPVNAALSFFKEQFKIHDILLTISLSKDLPKVKADPQKFEQIVVNFLSNARYAVEKKAESSAEQYQKKVTVRLFHDTGRDVVVFEVEDNGIGMGQEVLDRCMEPFYTTKGVGDGTGLGLSIVHGIVRESNMEMEVESVEGKGSTFRIIVKGVNGSEVQSSKVLNR